LTWSRIRDVLPKANSEVQRAMAEVWGSVLRRLKSAYREKALVLLAQELENISDVAAWSLVFACKVSSWKRIGCLVLIIAPVHLPNRSHRLSIHTYSDSGLSPIVR
jgi:hypothetical protein